mgnify:CR=1 FL=1
MSFLAMIKFVPRWAYGLLGVVAILVGLTRWHNGRVDDAVARERDRLGAVYAQELADAQAKADEKTKANASTTAQLDTNYYKEYQNATKTADYWRNRAMSERVPNQANCATDNATHSTSGGMGNDTATASIDNRPLDVPSTAVVELSTIAGQMRAQVEYLQAKHLADVQTVNGE